MQEFVVNPDCSARNIPIGLTMTFFDPPPFGEIDQSHRYGTIDLEFLGILDGDGIQVPLRSALNWLRLEMPLAARNIDSVPFHLGCEGMDQAAKQASSFGNLIDRKRRVEQERACQVPAADVAWASSVNHVSAPKPLPEYESH